MLVVRCEVVVILNADLTFAKNCAKIDWAKSNKKISFIIVEVEIVDWKLNSQLHGMADKDKKEEKSKVDLGLLEEDDEFEEFPAESELLLEIVDLLTMTNKNFNLIF